MAAIRWHRYDVEDDAVEDEHLSGEQGDKVVQNIKRITEVVDKPKKANVDVSTMFRNENVRSTTLCVLSVLSLIIALYTYFSSHWVMIGLNSKWFLRPQGYIHAGLYQMCYQLKMSNKCVGAEIMPTGVIIAHALHTISVLQHIALALGYPMWYMHGYRFGIYEKYAEKLPALNFFVGLIASALYSISIRGLVTLDAKNAVYTVGDYVVNTDGVVLQWSFWLTLLTHASCLLPYFSQHAFEGDQAYPEGETSDKVELTTVFQPLMSMIKEHVLENTGKFVEEDPEDEEEAEEIDDAEFDEAKTDMEDDNPAVGDNLQNLERRLSRIEKELMKRECPLKAKKATVASCQFDRQRPDVSKRPSAPLTVGKLRLMQADAIREKVFMKKVTLD